MGPGSPRSAPPRAFGQDDEAEGRLREGPNESRIADLRFAAAGLPVAVATQKPQRLARTVLEHHGVDGLFHGIHGSADDESAVEGIPVGKTGIIAAALKDLDTQHAVMVGDRAQDVSGAIANGLDCIGVAWGFAPDGELEEAGAVAIVETAEGLAELIGRMQAAHASAMSGVSNDGHV